MITKGVEPNSLTQHRAKHTAEAPSDYANYPAKDDLRASLVAEQKALCCYCTGRLSNDPLKMKIEHWQCQAAYPALQLVYGNLLGACLGGEGQSPADQHCDTKKANLNLKWNPANTYHAIETKIRYLADGTVESSDSEFNAQLKNVLNLNIKYLQNSRKAALDSMLNWWRLTPDARQKVQKQIARLTSNAAEHQPFSPVAVWFLRQKLGVAAA
jgi:uncharacterized protein (TIGR02646 family)